MLRKAAALSIAWYAFAIILSGCRDKCNCPPQPTYNFRWTNLGVTTHAWPIKDWIVTENPDTSLDFTAKSLLIKAHLNYELITATQCPGQRSIFSQAYACSCVEPNYHPEHALSSIKVITVQPFDGAHPAMTEVTDYFKSKNYNDKGQPDGLRSLNLRLDYGYAGEMPLSYYDLYLDRRPTLGSDHQFKVVFTLSDSSTISATTAVVRF
jgi:hypothetical protein